MALIPLKIATAIGGDSLQYLKYLTVSITNYGSDEIINVLY